jgi:hypothetical protein
MPQELEFHMYQTWDEEAEDFQISRAQQVSVQKLMELTSCQFRRILKKFRLD